MSGKLMGHIYDFKLTRSQREVLICIADHSYDDGTHVWPSVPRIAWKIDMDRRTVQRVKRQLEDMGVLVPVANLQGGRGHATIYEIHLEVLEPKTPFRPTKDDILPPFGGSGGVKGDIIVTPFSPEETTKSGVTPPIDEKSDTTPPIDETPTVKGGILNTKGGILNTKGGILNTKGGIAMPPEPSYNHHIEPLGEPLAAAPLASSLTEEDFDRAGRLWDRIREQLLPSIPPGQQHWLKDVELAPDPRHDGWCLLVISNYQRTLIEMRWANVIELKAANLSQRRLPVSIMSREGYQRLWGIEADEEAPEAAAEEEAVEA